MLIQAFATNWAATTRKVRNATQPYHDAYTEATPEQRKDLRAQWMRGFLIGDLSVTEKVADRILSQSRDDRTAEHQLSVKRASADFSYHIIRPQAKPAGAGKTDPVAKALALVESMTAAQKRRFLAAI